MREQIDSPTCRTLPQRVLKKAYEIEYAIVGSGLVRAHDFVAQMCRQTLLPSTVAPDRTPNAGCDGIEEPEFRLPLGPEILRGCLGRNCEQKERCGPDERVGELVAKRHAPPRPGVNLGGGIKQVTCSFGPCQLVNFRPRISHEISERTVDAERRP